MSTAIPCPCGKCGYWLVEPEAALQGVSFTEAQARAVAALLNRKVHDAGASPEQEHHT